MRESSVTAICGRGARAGARPGSCGSLGRSRGGGRGRLAGLGRALWGLLGPLDLGRATGWRGGTAGMGARPGAVVGLGAAGARSPGGTGTGLGATTGTGARTRGTLRTRTTPGPLLSCLNELNFPAIDFLSRQFLKGVFQIAVGSKLNHPFVELGSMGVSERDLSSLSHEIFQVLHIRQTKLTRHRNTQNKS